MKTRLLKPALGAAAVLIVFGVVTFWPSSDPAYDKWWLGSSAVWGQEILAQLDTVKGITCREQSTFVFADGSTHTSSTWNKFYLSHDSYRRDIYDGDTQREIQWYVPDANGTLFHSIRFDKKCYFTHSGAGGIGHRDPVERMRFYVKLLDRADALLGERQIEGRNCVGFKIRASQYGNNPESWTDCIWFDVGTKLPVRIEHQGRPVTDRPEWSFTNTQDQFNYNPELPADTFTPWVPEGYIHSHPDDVE